MLQGTITLIIYVIIRERLTGVTDLLIWRHWRIAREMVSAELVMTVNTNGEEMWTTFEIENVENLYAFISHVSLLATPR